MAIEMIYTHSLAHVVRRVGPTYAVVRVGFDEFLVFVWRLILRKSKGMTKMLDVSCVQRFQCEPR